MKKTKIKLHDLIMKVTSRPIEPVDWLSIIQIDEENKVIETKVIGRHYRDLTIKPSMQEHCYSDLRSAGYNIIIETNTGD